MDSHTEKLLYPFSCEGGTALDRCNALPAWGRYFLSFRDSPQSAGSERTTACRVPVMDTLMERQTAWCPCAPPPQTADTDGQGSLKRARTHSPGTSFALSTQLMISKCQNDCIQNVPLKNTCSWPLNLHDKWFLPSRKCIKPKPRKIFHQHSAFSEEGKTKGHLNLCTSLPFPNTCRLQIRASDFWRCDWNCMRQIMAPSFKQSLWALESLPHFSGLLEFLAQSQFLINFPPSLPLLCFLTPPINP